MAVKWADDCWLLKYLVEKHTGEQLFEWVWCTRSDRHAIVSRRSQASPTIRDSRLVASMPWRLFFPGRSADRTNIFSGMLSPLVFVLLAELVRSSPYLSLSQAPLDQRKSLFFIVYFFFFLHFDAFFAEVYYDGVRLHLLIYVCLIGLLISIRNSWRLGWTRWNFKVGLISQPVGQFRFQAKSSRRAFTLP